MGALTGEQPVYLRSKLLNRVHARIIMFPVCG
jgi:hypothetical protein